MKRPPPRVPVAGLLAAVLTLAACTGADTTPTPSPTPAATADADDDLAGPTDTPPECDLREVDPSCAVWRIDDVEAADGTADLAVVAVGPEVVAVDPATGDERWRADVPSGAAEVLGFQVAADGVLVVVEADAQTSTAALAREDGSVIWSSPGAPDLLARDATVVGMRTADDPELLSVVELASGDTLWETRATPLGFTVIGEAALVDDGAAVHLLDAATGERRWRTEGVGLDASVVLHPGPLGEAIAGRRRGSGAASAPVLLAADDGEVVELAADVGDGWALETVAGTELATNRFTTVGLAPDGSERWRIEGRPVVPRRGDAVLVAAEAGGREGVVLLDPLDGARLWQRAVDSDEIRDLHLDDVAVAVTRLTSITVHDRATGVQRVVLRGADPRVLSTTPLVVADGDTLVGVAPDRSG